jgi:hypothetical protein
MILVLHAVWLIRGPKRSTYIPFRAGFVDPNCAVFCRVCVIKGPLQVCLMWDSSSGCKNKKLDGDEEASGEHCGGRVWSSRCRKFDE